MSRLWCLTLIKTVVTDTELHEAIAANDKVVVVFSAKDWCVPCRRLAPHIDIAAEKLPEVIFIEVDIDKSEDIRKAYDVMSVPFVVGFKGGNLVGEIKSRTAVQLVSEVSSL